MYTVSSTVLIAFQALLVALASAQLLIPHIRLGVCFHIHKGSGHG
jgi:hypothetical protein